MEEKLRDLTFGRAVILSLVLGAIYYFAMYNDGAVLEKQIEQANLEINKSKAELESLRQAIVDAERFEQTRSILGAEMDRVLRAIPAKLNSLELMRIMSNEAKAVGAQINSITAPQNFRAKTILAKDAPVPFYEAVDIELDLTGTYNQIMLFLSNLTRLDKIITVKKMTIALSKTTGILANSSPSINMKASVSAHKSLSPEEQAAMMPKAPAPKLAPAKAGK